MNYAVSKETLINMYSKQAINIKSKTDNGQIITLILMPYIFNIEINKITLWFNTISIYEGENVVHVAFKLDALFVAQYTYRKDTKELI